MQLFGRQAIRGISGFGSLKRTEPHFRAIYLDLGAPRSNAAPAGVVRYTLKPRGIRFMPPPVFHILGVSTQSNIASAIVERVAVYVIHHRPTRRGKDKPMKEIRRSATPDRLTDIALRIYRPAAARLKKR